MPHRPRKPFFTVARLLPWIAISVPTLALAASDEPRELATVTVVSSVSGDDPVTPKRVSLGPLGERDVMETPFSIGVVSETMINEQQLKSYRDILKFLPSVQYNAGRIQSRGIQGSVVQNSLLDGLNVVSTTDYPAEQFEQVEVLQGLAGSIFGPATPSGMFNFQSKRPTAETRNSVSLGVSTGTSSQVAADLGGPVGASGRVKYRLNLLDEEGDGYAPNSTRARQLVSLATDFRLTDSTLLETNLSYYHYKVKGLPGAFALATGVKFPDAPDPTTRNLGQSYAGDDNTTQTGSLHLKHAFNDNWHADLGLLRQIADREYTAVTNTLTNNAGRYTTTTSQSTASRFAITSYLASLNGKVSTGNIQHDLTFGYRGFDWDTYNPVNGGTITLGTSNLSNPSAFATPNFPDFHNRYRIAKATQNAFILGDTIEFSPQWSAMLTGSQDYLSSRNFSKTGVQTSHSDDDGLSGSASLIYKPIAGLMFYGTYADSLQQGDVAPSGTSNAGTILSPYRSKQYEIGSKYTFREMNYTLAGFQIKRPFAFTQTDGSYGEAGEQRNRGIEFSTDGKLTRNLRVFGGVTWLDPRLLKTASASTENKQIVGLSKVVVSLMTVYQLPWMPQAALNFNVYHASQQATDNANSAWVDGYTTYDVGASYRMPLGKTNATFRLQVNNVTNERYWTSIRPGGLNGYSGTGNASAQLGMPRMVYGSVQFDF
jgi:iron complex outermembrane recepter protein